MSNTIDGVVKVVSPTRKLDNGDFINGFAITVSQNGYEKDVYFEGYKKEIPDGVKVGAEVKVYFDVKSREYQGKWFSQINFWKVETKAPAAPMGVEDKGWQGGAKEDFLF